MLDKYLLKKSASSENLSGRLNLLKISFLNK